MATGADELHLNAPILHALAKKVKPRINMLTAVMEDGVLAEGDGCFVVDLQRDLLRLCILDIAGEPSKPDALAGRCRGGDILRLAGGQSYTTLCLCDCQLIKLLPRKKKTLVVFLRVSTLPALSLSLKPTRVAPAASLA